MKNVSIRSFTNFSIYLKLYVSLNVVLSCLDFLCDNAFFFIQTDNIARVNCKDKSMDIHLDKRFFNSSLYSISLKNQSCIGVDKGNAISLSTELTKCGTRKRENVDRIIYENEVQLKARSFGSIIVRNFDQSIKFTCSYNKSGNTGVIQFIPISKLNVTERK